MLIPNIGIGVGLGIGTQMKQMNKARMSICSAWHDQVYHCGGQVWENPRKSSDIC